MGPKWAQNNPKKEFFDFFWKILLLFLAGFGVQWKFRELFVSVLNSYIKENSDSQVINENGPKNDSK